MQAHSPNYFIKYLVHYSVLAGLTVLAMFVPLVMGAGATVLLALLFPATFPIAFEIIKWTLYGPFILDANRRRCEAARLKSQRLAKVVEVQAKTQNAPTRQKTERTKPVGHDAELQAAYAMGLSKSQGKLKKSDATRSVKLKDLPIEPVVSPVGLADDAF